MSEELKPCPHCGEERYNDLYVCKDGRVVCQVCGSVSLDKRIWNLRPIEDELRRRIGELEARVMELGGEMYVASQEDR